LGKFFEILTDHCALCVLNERMPNSARLRRWAIIMSEFNYKIIFTKGNMHQDIDCLSRAPVDTAPDEYLDDRVYAITVPLNHADWKNACQDDESKTLYEKARKTEEELHIIDGLVYYRNRLYVPLSRRKEITMTAHNESTLHGGVLVTTAKLEENYWWPNMNMQSKRYLTTRTASIKYFGKATRDVKQPGNP